LCNCSEIGNKLGLSKIISLQSLRLFSILFEILLVY